MATDLTLYTFNNFDMESEGNIDIPQMLRSKGIFKKEINEQIPQK
jgi:hypothetical protein